MNVRLNRRIKIKGSFFRGRPEDRVGLVFRTVFNGMTVMVTPSPSTPSELVPNVGERWEVELDREFLSYDVEKGVAKIHCHPIRELPEIGEGLPVMHRKKVLIKGVQYPSLSAATVRSILTPAPTKTPARKQHPRRQFDIELRNRQKNGGKGCGKKQQTA